MNNIRNSQYDAQTLSICDCGLADYRSVLQQQLQLWEQRRQNKIPDTILIVEHPPVITLGARLNANKLLVVPEQLLQKGIDIVNIRRGGGATAHNPGQLVFYPILNLQHLGLGINEYIRELETIGIELLKQLCVCSTRRKGYPGLWIGNNSQSKIVNRQFKKVASIGVRVSKGVTYHGMAINIQNDLSIFDLIVPCGLDGIEMTSVLKETGNEQSMADVKNKLKILLCEHLGKTEDR